MKPIELRARKSRNTFKLRKFITLVEFNLKRLDDIKDEKIIIHIPKTWSEKQILSMISHEKLIDKKVLVV